MNAVRRLVASKPDPTDEDIAGCRVEAEDFKKSMDKFGPKSRQKLSEYGKE